MLQTSWTSTSGESRRIWVFTLGPFCGQEMGSHSPKLLWERIWSEKCLLHSAHLHIDEPKKYTFHSYRRSAATAVADAGATSDQMQDFFGAKMTTEYISTSKAAIIKVTQKLQDTETKDNLGHVNVAEKACKESS